MQNNDWVELFRLIPVDQHSTLVLTTVSGMDINLEIVLRTEGNFLVFRGRVSGSTDEGRVFFLPYRQIDFLQINRHVKEVEIRRLFGEEVEERFGVNATASSHQSGSFSAMSTQMGSRPDAPADTNQLPSNATTTPQQTAVPALASPLHGSAQGVAARSSIPPSPAPTLADRLKTPPPSLAGVSPPSARASNVPAAALVPQGPPSAANGTDQPTPPRNSILERLRAQRNSILPPRAPGR